MHKMDGEGVGDEKSISTTTALAISAAKRYHEVYQQIRLD